MTKNHLIYILTEDHYLPGTTDQLLTYIEEYFENTVFSIIENEEEPETYRVFHQESDLSIFQLAIRQHNDNCSLLQVIDQQGSIKLMTTISHKPFLQKIVSGAKELYVLINNYKNWCSRNNQDQQFNLDLQESGYNLTKEEAETIGIILSKMAAMKAQDITKMTDISFKLSFSARNTNE